MKKVTDFLRPNLLIVLGAILLLYFLNWLSYGQAGLVATGAYGITAGSCMLAIGIVSVVLGEKVNGITRKIFEVVAVSLFATLMFVYFLVYTIIFADAGMGPTAWIIKILSIIASLGFIGIYIPARFTNQKVLVRFAYLFSAIFGLALLLDVLFKADGSAAQLDDFDIILVVAYVLFMIYLFGTLGKEEPAPVVKEEPKQVEAPKEEPQEEVQEQPQEPVQE